MCIKIQLSVNCKCKRDTATEVWSGEYLITGALVAVEVAKCKHSIIFNFVVKGFFELSSFLFQIFELKQKYEFEVNEQGFTNVNTTC